MEQDQREAAVWFERKMTSENGKWMLAQSFLGAANNNIGQESFYKYMKKATSGKMSVTLAYFKGAMCRYKKDISEEQVSEERKYNKDVGDMQLLYSYPTAPTISVKCWEDVQSMDANTLVCSRIPIESTWPCMMVNITICCV